MQGCKEVSLGHIAGSGSGSDFRLLNAGWMFADAVLGTKDETRYLLTQLSRKRSMLKVRARM